LWYCIAGEYRPSGFRGELGLKSGPSDAMAMSDEEGQVPGERDDGPDSAEKTDQRERDLE
jgi:hypothetical protein